MNYPSKVLQCCLVPVADMSEIVVRISRYISGATYLLQLPVAEAMLTYKENRYLHFFVVLLSTRLCVRERENSNAFSVARSKFTSRLNGFFLILVKRTIHYG